MSLGPGRGRRAASATAPQGGRACAAATHRVVTTPELAPFAGALLDLDDDAGPAPVNWPWIATADVAEVAAWLERVRDGRWWPARED